MIKKCCWTIWASKSGKNLRSKIWFSLIWFLNRDFFLVKKSYRYPNSNSPLFGPIVKKTCWKFCSTILPFWHSAIRDFFIFIFSIWDPKFNWFPVGPFGLTFMKNYWWGIWPSCQMMKKCCWPIWAPKSGIFLRPDWHFWSRVWLQWVIGPKTTKKWYKLLPVGIFG